MEQKGENRERQVGKRDRGMQQYKQKEEDWETTRQKQGQSNGDRKADSKEAKEPKETEREIEKTEILEHTEIHKQMMQSNVVLYI